MPVSVVSQACEWIAGLPKDEKLTVTFHGGEPLAVGLAYYRHALPQIRAAHEQTVFSIQSNLWFLSEMHLDLFGEYQVHLGTSLDGPEEINDRQRGAGYFRRTMAKVDLARRRGSPVGSIVTLTSWSAAQWREVIRFFEGAVLDVSLHAALPGLRAGKGEWALPPERFGEVLAEIFRDWLENDSPIHIQPIESMCNGMISGGTTTCMFGDCLGKFYAIDPHGDIYPCQRFVGFSQYRLGTVAQMTAQSWSESDVWKLLDKRRRAVTRECEGCAFWEDCQGGCPYNALARYGSNLEPSARDPFCEAYRNLFSCVLDQAAEDFFSPENLEDIVVDPQGSRGILRKSRLMRRLYRSARA
jgi:uncharacterized protein